MTELLPVLGLDPANHTGYSHSDGFRGVLPLVSNVDRFPGQRLNRFREWLRATLQTHPTKLIASEDASFGSPNPAVQASHNELRAVILMVAAEFQIDTKLFAPTTIKKFATGNGHSQKWQMVKAVQRNWGIDVYSDDEADAICVMKLGQLPSEWPRPSQKPRGRQPRNKFPKTKRLF